MGTTPLWVPLAVAAIAVLGTLGGVVFTQVWNSRLEERRSAREGDRLRDLQDREDLNRTYEHRRAAYVDYLEEFDRLVAVVDANTYRGFEGPAPDPEDPFFDQLRHRLTLVTVYGTPEAGDLASKCITALYEWAEGSLESGTTKVNEARAAYLKQIRKDLGVPAE